MNIWFQQFFGFLRGLIGNFQRHENMFLKQIKPKNPPRLRKSNRKHRTFVDVASREEFYTQFFQNFLGHPAWHDETRNVEAVRKAPRGAITATYNAFEHGLSYAHFRSKIYNYKKTGIREDRRVRKLPHHALLMQECLHLSVQKATKKYNSEIAKVRPSGRRVKYSTMNRWRAITNRQEVQAESIPPSSSQGSAHSSNCDNNQVVNASTLSPFKTQTYMRQ